MFFNDLLLNMQVRPKSGKDLVIFMSIARKCGGSVFAARGCMKVAPSRDLWNDLNRILAGSRLCGMY